jgi:hypothetical protein
MSKVISRSLIDLSALVGFCNTAGCQISNLIFEFIFAGALCISHEQLATDDNVLSHLGFMSKVFSGSLNDLSAWVDFCTRFPQEGVKYQL